MTLSTEQLKARAESLGLDFFIEQRAGIWVKEWLNDGCTSATAEEVMMWSMLANREAQPVAEVQLVEDFCGCCHSPYVQWLGRDGNQFPVGTKFYTAPPADAELLDVAIALREWIEAVPSEVAASLPTMPGFDRDWVDEVIDACRAAALAQPVSQGYKLVPVEPTEEMLRAAYREAGVYSAKVYRAMLAAAPEGGK